MSPDMTLAVANAARVGWSPVTLSDHYSVLHSAPVNNSNNVLWFLLTVITLGLLLPVWLIVLATSANGKPGVLIIRRNEFGTLVYERG